MSRQPSADRYGGRLPSPQVVPPPPVRARPRRRRASATAVLMTLVVGVALVLLLAAAMVAAYYSIAFSLPPAESLRGQSAGFLSTRIFDRNGDLLYEIADPQGGRRILVPYEDISPYLRDATVATEDSRFWQHPGVDPIGIVRAVIQNVRGRSIVSGASTIPQQLVKLVLLSPEERTAQTLSRKVREAVLAAEVSRRYTKEEILQIYLNEINYGNLAYGIEAAAETYFGKDAGSLTLAEAAFLAGLPQAPAYWDPYTNWEGARRRQAVVLGLMADQGYITAAQAEGAKAEELTLQPLRFDVEAPHFVTYIQQVLEQKYGADVLYRSGLSVTTTLDAGLQAIAEQELRAHLATLAADHATNGALIALDPATGEILAMVGSADFNDAAISGQINMTLRPRQPGSSIKPVTYVAAFEKGWTPATLIWDVTTAFPDGAGGAYVPVNYDRKEHGPVLVRSALAQSLNVPAVKALDFVGLPAMLDAARRMGIASLTRPDYGLSLTLGGGEVTPLEMAGAYAVLANGGRRVPPVGILRITDAAGRLVEDYQPPAGDQVVSPQHAYLITDILSDDEARAPIFGRNGVLKLSRPAAAKTGTTNDYRDAWTVGYTPELVTAVWVGNADNSEMSSVAGSRGAAPIWHNFMEQALAGRPASAFARPEGIDEIEISADSGSLPGDACPPDRRRRELFAAGQGPLGPENDFHRLLRIDTATGALATDFCPAGQVEERYFLVLPGPDGQKWAADHGIPQPPAEACPLHSGPTQAVILQPLPGDLVTGSVYVLGRATGPDFSFYSLAYGQGQDPAGWWQLGDVAYAPVEGGVLALWDVSALPDGDYSLRLAVVDRAGNTVQARTWVRVQSPTPTATLEPTWTPWPTETPWPTLTPWPTEGPTPTATPGFVETPWPTATPSPTEGPPIEPPTATPTPVTNPNPGGP